MAYLYETEAFVVNRVPLRIFNHTLEGDNIYTPLHWHRNIEFNLTTKGRINLMIDGRSKNIYKGEWCVVNSGELHSNRWIDKEDYFCGVTVQISKSFVDNWIGKNVIFHLPEDEDIYSQVAEYIVQFGELKKQEQSIEKGLDLEKMQLLYGFLILIRDYCTDFSPKIKVQQTKNIDTLKNVINYIDEHYMEEITLASVAEQFNYSSAHLSKSFKEHIGYKFHDYVQNVRLLNCVNDMKENNSVSLIECCLKNGFPNQKSFIKAFRDTFGCTPSEYKNIAK
jgi:AraC-like DNA-binding protein